MKIGFDISQTGRFKAGCGCLADSLIRELSVIDQENDYVLYPTFGNFFGTRIGPRKSEGSAILGFPFTTAKKPSRVCVIFGKTLETPLRKNWESRKSSTPTQRHCGNTGS